MGINARYAHSEGHTNVCYDDSGDCMLTCGSDGEMRLWKGLDEDPVDHKMGVKVTAIAIKNGRFFVSTDSNAVQAYTYPDVIHDGIILRFTAPVNHVDVGNSGKYLLAGSSDFTMKLVDLVDSSVKHFQGHEAPVLSVALDPLDAYVASSSCDGSVKIWEIESSNCVKTFPAMLVKSNDFCMSKSLCRIHWQPTSGKFLAVPTFQEVKLFERGSWTELLKFQDESAFEVMNVAKFSPCGNYVAAATVQGTVLIWEMSTEKLIEKHQHEKKLTICSFAWNPSGKKEIAFCDKNGQLDVLDSILANETEFQSHIDKSVAPTRAENVFEDFTDDEDDENTFSIEKIKAQTIPGYSRECGLLGIAKNSSINNENDKIFDVDEQFADIDLPVISKPAPKLPDFQKPFQPGSTPSYREHHYLVWNSVGIIICRNTDQGNTIEISFHGAPENDFILIENTSGYTMAALSTEAAVFACAAQRGNPSKVTYHNFSSSDGNEKWDVDMPGKENIQAVAIGDTWLAVCTDAKKIRFFTIGGNHLQVVSISGAVVSMAASDKFLAVAYHACRGVHGLQSQSVTIFSLNEVGIVVASESVLLPLPKRSTLSWIGFTDELTPCVVNSNGVVQLLSKQNRNIWIPICDTKSQVKEGCEYFFVVGVGELEQVVRCVQCEDSRYPQTSPRPATVTLPFKLPLCELNTERGQLEESFWRSKLRLETMDQFNVDELKMEVIRTNSRADLMKLFALACRSDRIFRAYELCELMDSLHSIQLAMKYAAKMNRAQLVERLTVMATEKMNAELQHVSFDESKMDQGNDAESEMSAEGFNVTLGDQPAQSSAVSNAATNDPAKITSGPNPQKPTVQMSLFNTWMRENRAKLESDNPEASSTEISLLAIRAFKSLSSRDIEDLRQRVSEYPEPDAKRRKTDG